MWCRVHTTRLAVTVHFSMPILHDIPGLAIGQRTIYVIVIREVHSIWHSHHWGTGSSDFSKTNSHGNSSTTVTVHLLFQGGCFNTLN